jgi:hypothetical protein
MIVLDTNVVSDIMRDRPNESVLRFFGRSLENELFITSITVAEIRYGLRRLPSGRRRTALDDAFERFLENGFREKVLPFDGLAADAYAQVVVGRQHLGRSIDAFDAMIAGVALVCGAAVATRDIYDFEDCGLDLINPWEF